MTERSVIEQGDALIAIHEETEAKWINHVPDEYRSSTNPRTNSIGLFWGALTMLLVFGAPWLFALLSPPVSAGSLLAISLVCLVFGLIVISFIINRKQALYEEERNPCVENAKSNARIHIQRRIKEENIDIGAISAEVSRMHDHQDWMKRLRAILMK